MTDATFSKAPFSVANVNAMSRRSISLWVSHLNWVEYLLQYASKRLFSKIDVETYLVSKCWLTFRKYLKQYGSQQCHQCVNFQCDFYRGVCIQCNISFKTSMLHFEWKFHFWVDTGSTEFSGDQKLLSANQEIIFTKFFHAIDFQGRHEFYRFMPNEKPPVKVFPVKGMMINVSASFLFTEGRVQKWLLISWISFLFHLYRIKGFIIWYLFDFCTS